jgi:hypothetical protein
LQARDRRVLLQLPENLACPFSIELARVRGMSHDRRRRKVLRPQHVVPVGVREDDVAQLRVADLL